MTSHARKILAKRTIGALSAPPSPTRTRYEASYRRGIRRLGRAQMLEISWDVDYYKAWRRHGLLGGMS